AFQHDRLLWVIGFVSAGMTAFYMFRAVFMTFFGELRAKPHSANHAHAKGGHDAEHAGHGDTHAVGQPAAHHAQPEAVLHHGSHDVHVHESSGWMTWPLVILAAGSLLSGFLGVPAALGGANRFEAWLEPVLGHGAHAAEAHASAALEYGTMAAYVGIAL